MGTEQMATKLLLPMESDESLTTEFLRDFVERFAEEGLDEVRLDK